MIDNISENLFNNTQNKRIPLIVNYEITDRCNESCFHCYHRGEKKKDNELSAFGIKKLLKSLKKEGTLFLIITGGEPFLREDIFEILEFVYNLGFATIIYTNGTLLNRQAVKKLKQLNIFSLHISLYSLKPEVHDRITGLAGSFKKTLNAVNMLKKEDLHTVVKVPVMNENIDEVAAILSWSEENKIEVKIDPFISPSFGGEYKKVLAHRIFPESMMSVMDICRKDDEEFRFNKSVECSAGKNMVGIDASGNIMPCIVWRENFGNVQSGNFKDIW